MDDKVKFLCSFGGKLSPRPGDGRLRYSGGETRIVGFQRNVRYSEFVSKLREVCDLREEKIVTKYQPVQCDLDHLVSVVSDEDVKYMMDEANCTDGSRIRLFLFPYVGDSMKRQQQFDYNQKKCNDRSGYSDEYSKKTSDKQHNQQAQLIQKNVYTGMPMSQPPDQGILSRNEGSRGHPAQQYAMEKRQVVVQPQPQPQPQAHNVGPDWHAQSIMGDFHGVGQGNYQPRSSNYMHYQEDPSLYANRPYIEHSPHMYNDASHKQVVYNSSGEAYVMPGSNHSSMEYQIHDDPQARKSGGQNENYNWIDYQQRGDPQPHSGNLRHHYVLPDQEYRLVGGGQGQLLSPSRQNPEINRGVVVPGQYEPREIKHTQSKKSVMENKRPIIEPPEVLPISYPIQSPQRRADYLAYEQSDRLSDRFPSGQSEDSNVTISSARYQPTERYPSGQSEDNSVAFYPSRYPEAGMPRGQAYPERPELSQKGQYAGKGNSSTEEPSIANNNQRDIHRPFSLITDRSLSEPSSTEKYGISSYNERTLQERSSTEKRAIVNSKPGGYEYTSEAPLDEQYVINMERPYIDFRGSSDSGFASEEKSQSNGISNKQIYHTDMMQEQLPKDFVVEKASKAKKENIQIKSSSNTESESDSQLKSLERGRKETGVVVPQTEKLLEIRGVSYDELPAKRHNESGITAPPKALSDRDYTESIGNSSVASSHQMPLVYQEQSIHNSLELRDHVFRHNSANYDKDSYALTTAAISNPLSRHQAEHLQHSHESLIANIKNSSFDAPNQRLSYDSIPPQSTRVSQSSSSNQEARSSKGNHHFLQGSTSIDDLSIPSHFPPLLQQGIIPVRPAKSFEDGDHLLEQTHQRAYQDQSLLYEGISKSGGSSSYKQYERRGYLSPQDSTFATDATLDTFYKGGSISGDHKKHFSSDGNQKLSPQSEAEKLGRIPTNSDDSKRVEKLENVRNVNIGYQKDLGSQFITKQPNYNGDRVKKTQIDGTGNLSDLDLSFDTSSRELVPVIQVGTSTGVAGTIDALDHVQSGACFSLNIRAPDRNVKAYKESSEPKMPPLSGKNPVVATTNSPMYGHALGNGKKGNDAMETDPAQMSTFEMSYLEGKVNNLKLSQQENRFGGNNVADVGSAFSSSSSDSSIHDPGKMFSLAISSFAPKKDNTVIQYGKKEVKEGGHVRYNDEVSLPSEQAHLQESLANEIDMEEQAKKLSLEMARTMAMEAEAEALAKGLQMIRNNDLEEIRELGSGTYGTVYHGKWRGSDVAIKRIKASCFEGSPTERGRLIADFWKEATILSQLHHPNVVSFYGVVRDGPNDSLATVTEFMVNGSLKTVLRKKDRNLDRRKRLILAMDAAFGMEYLHEKNIVHFDLKCENLLVNMRDPQRPLCKIGDMGLSKVKHQTLVTGGVRGTLPWMAPELLTGDSGMVSDKVDVYSFAIVMWELLTGEEPYANLHCGSIIGGIMKNTLRPTIPSWCEPAWKSLMERCWANDPRKRPSFSEISVELRAVAAGNKWC